MPVGRTNATALLQKVNSQLRGERVPLKTKEEDELANYLSNLTKKTQQVREQNSEEYGDISISSGADARNSLIAQGRRSTSPANQPVTSAGSKFLKKKPAQDQTQGQSENFEDYDRKAIVVSGGKDASFRPSKKSSALDKVDSWTSKIKGRSVSASSARRHDVGDSDSDESGRGSEFSRRPRSADTSVGRDGGKFLKNMKTSVVEDRVDMRSPSPYQKKKEQERKRKIPDNKSMGEIVRTLGNVYLTSEEESLAEFIHGLSASESSVKRPQNLVAKKQQKWRKKPTPQLTKAPSPVLGSRSPSPFKRSPSPFGRPYSRSMSQDSDVMESMASEIMEENRRRAGSVSSEDRFNVNVMDVSSLFPVASSSTSAKSKGEGKGKSKGKSSPFKAKDKDSSKGGKRKKSVDSSLKKSSSGLLENLGIFMVDDLLGDATAFPDKEVAVSEDESEIPTEKSDIERRQLARRDSESEIITEIGGGSKKRMIARNISNRAVSSVASISEKIGADSSIRKPKPKSEDTDVDEYSESFLTESDSRTATPSVSYRSRESRAKHRRRRRSRDRSTSHGSRQKGDRKMIVEEKRVDISTADQHGGMHHWNATHTGLTVTGPYGLQYVDPAPVATRVISSDALETLTAYSPNILALQEMMKAQLDLVKNFVAIQQRIYKSCMDGLNEDFHYTTLEDTKEFLRQNRKPRMTFAEALKLVDLEDAEHAS